ncbi:MAG: ABC-2 family transporter protein [Mobilitalea sp.]
MLTVVKNQCKVMLLSVRYNIMREMTNRVSFLMYVSFMVLNNATFIIQWLLLFSLKSDIGGYSIDEVMLLWGLAAGTFGFAHVFFTGGFLLSDLIINGKLDAFLVQPKNVLLSAITSRTSSAAIGDVVYGYLIVIIFHFSIGNLLWFTIYSIMGAIIMTAFAVITESISFWLIRGDLISDNLNGLIINFSTYPDGIFKGIVRILLFTVLPVGMIVYLPVKLILKFHLLSFLYLTGFTIGISLLAFFIFYRGLKRYSSSNLMIARM